MVARCLQGAGAALMLGASLPVLTALQGSAAAGRRLWAGAGVIGAVIGPAVGGLLTQVFDWRAIFYLQAPVAALALVGVLAERSRKRAPVDPSSHLGGRIGWRAVWADLALAFVGRRVCRRAVPRRAPRRRGVARTSRSLARSS